MSDGEPTIFRGRYQLQQSIGKGGMAEVFLGMDDTLKRPVAIKRLDAQHAVDPSFVERFQREARAAANLTHPNIVQVFDYFEEDGQYLIVQEYVDGRSLADILRSEGRLHPDRAADIASDIAAGLGAAHREGMVHRDVKSANVLVAKDGHVKVADFGIARVFAGGDSELTQAGTVMGTAAYFSPEQAQGKPVDPRSDLYSLGVVLYEMLVGRTPFTGDEPVAIAYAHVHEDPTPLREIDPALPREIEAITMKLLAKDPARRYPSADDLRDDLRRYREGFKLPDPKPTPVPVPADPPAPRKRRKLPEEIDFGSFEDGRYVEPPRRTGWFLVFTLAVLGALALGLVYLAEQLDDEQDRRTLTVPDVEGQNRQAAQSQLRRAGFRVRVREEASVNVARDVVISQDPAAGEEADERSIVTIVVSTGAAEVEVPSVLGQDVFTATQTLQQAGFEVQVEQREDPNEQFSEGQIWEQVPGAGTPARVGTIVIVRVVPVPPSTTTPSAGVVSPPATAPPPPPAPTTAPTTG